MGVLLSVYSWNILTVSKTTQWEGHPRVVDVISKARACQVRFLSEGILMMELLCSTPEPVCEDKANCWHCRGDSSQQAISLHTCPTTLSHFWHHYICACGGCIKQSRGVGASERLQAAVQWMAACPQTVACTSASWLSFEGHHDSTFVSLDSTDRWLKYVKAIQIVECLLVKPSCKLPVGLLQ